MKIKKNMIENIYFVNQYDIDLDNLLNKSNSRNMIETIHLYLSYEVLLYSQSTSIIGKMYYILCNSILKLVYNYRYSNNISETQNDVLELLKFFEANFGCDFITPSIHSLVHFKEKIENFGDMLSLSTIDFERSFKNIKQMTFNNNIPSSILKKYILHQYVSKTNCEVELFYYDEFKYRYDDSDLNLNIWYKDKYICGAGQYANEYCYLPPKQLLEALNLKKLPIMFCGVVIENKTYICIIVGIDRSENFSLLEVPTVQLNCNNFMLCDYPDRKKLKLKFNELIYPVSMYYDDPKIYYIIQSIH